MKRMRFSSSMLVVLVMTGVVVGGGHRASAAVTITEFRVPTSLGPGPIAAGGEFVWFAEPNDDTIGRIDTHGAMVEFPLPSPYEEPRGIVGASDGTAWFTQTGGHTGGEGIGHVDPSGTITEFALPANTRPFGITIGPDGNLWFTEVGATWRIGRMTTSGAITEFPVALQNQPLNIVSGSDGALWFTEDGIVNGGTGAIGRITTAGDLTEFLLPTPAGVNSGAGDIAVGADGNLWFTWVTQASSGTGPASHSVGRITPSGVITEFPVSTDGGWPPGGITAGPDGSLWFARGVANLIVQITTSGTMTDHVVPTPGAFPVDVVAGADGNVWFSEADASAIGRVNLAPSAGEHERSVTLKLTKHLRAKGVLESIEAVSACWQDARLRIQRRVGGEWRAVATARTNARGVYKTPIPDREGTYRAQAPVVRLPGGDVCAEAVSPRKTHRHS